MNTEHVATEELVGSEKVIAYFVDNEKQETQVPILTISSRGRISCGKNHRRGGVCLTDWTTNQTAKHIIFLHPNVQAELGKDSLVDAIFNPLCNGRMRVLPQHISWVVSLIGADRARLCPSLPRTARFEKRNPEVAGGKKKRARAKRLRYA